MSYKILEKIRLNSLVWKLVIDVPVIAGSTTAGQFVVIRMDERGERIPLTISDFDKAKGTITIIFQEVGATTRRLGCLKGGDVVSDILGPLGKPTDFGKAGKVILIGG